MIDENFSLGAAVAILSKPLYLTLSYFGFGSDFVKNTFVFAFLGGVLLCLIGLAWIAISLMNDFMEASGLGEDEKKEAVENLRKKEFFKKFNIDIDKDFSKQTQPVLDFLYWMTVAFKGEFLSNNAQSYYNKYVVLDKHSEDYNQDVMYLLSLSLDSLRQFLDENNLARLTPRKRKFAEDILSVLHVNDSGKGVLRDSLEKEHTTILNGNEQRLLELIAQYKGKR